MNTKKLFCYVFAVLLGGCVPVMSLHPLFNKKDVVFDKKLLGTWVADPNSPENTWEFKRVDANENAYRLIFSYEEGKKGLFVAHLVKLKDKLFLDVCPAGLPEDVCPAGSPWEQQDPNKVNFWVVNTFFLVPAHTFIKINSIEPQLKILRTDDEKMAELLQANPNAVKHDFLEDLPGPAGPGPGPILTASTNELQAFVLKYVDDPRVFTDTIMLSRKKTVEPNALPPSKRN